MIDKLPNWETCALAVKADEATLLHKFIHENEPAGTLESKQFRDGLIAIINELEDNQ